MSRIELRNQAEVTSWLAAGLGLRRVPGTDDDVIVAGSILACASELPTMPPPGVIADVASLLAGVRANADLPTASDEALRTALRAYDDDVVGRLAATARFDDVLAAYAHLPDVQRPLAVALVVGALLERSGFVGLSVSPASLRRALARPREERDTIGRAELREGGDVIQTLASAYQQLARGARQSRNLVDDREVFSIDHLEVLGSFARRMAADHIGAAAEALASRLPRRLPANRDHRGVKDTQLADDTLYPAGGFTAITPGGSSANIENLVSSELVYMEDGDEVDLFTLRYVEGELLFYTRDDSVFRRHAHVITIALGPDLDDARVKDPDVPWQRLVLALGMLVASIRWLTEQLGHEALSIRLAFPPRQLAEEKELIALLLEGEIQQGIVTLTEEPWEAAVAGAAATTRAISDLVVVSLGPTPGLVKGQRALHLSLAGSAPVAYELAPRRGVTPDPNPDVWSEWSEATEDLLRWLV